MSETQFEHDRLNSREEPSVTLPLSLYERMARVYYGPREPARAPVQSTEPPIRDVRPPIGSAPIEMGALQLESLSDVPPGYVPRKRAMPNGTAGAPNAGSPLHGDARGDVDPHEKAQARKERGVVPAAQEPAGDRPDDPPAR